MFEFIEGTVHSAENGTLVLYSGQIGYAIHTDAITEGEARPGEEMTVYTYLSVKEDGISLFGCSSKERRDLFLLLLKINGIGPKTAMQIVGTPLPVLLDVIDSEDAAALSKLPGIGGKTAGRILTELPSMLKKADIRTGTDGVRADHRAVAEAQDALRSLGFNDSTIQKAFAKLTPNPSDDASVLLSKALQIIRS
jgi:Holliday junction DNA helicase RuvA